MAGELESIVIQLGLDRAALQRSLDDLGRLTDALGSVDQSLQSLEESGRAAHEAMATDELGRAAAQIETAQMTRLQRLRSVISRAEQQFSGAIAMRGQRIGALINRYDLFGLRPMKYSAYGSPLFNMAQAAQTIQGVGDEIRSLDQILSNARDAFTQFGGAIMKFGVSAGPAAVAAAALTAAIVAFELGAQRVRKRFNEIISALEKEIDLRNRLRQAEQSDPRELERQIQLKNEERQSILNAARAAVKLSLNEELPQYRAAPVDAIDTRAFQEAQRALIAGQISQVEFYKFQRAVRNMLVDALSESELVRIIGDMQMKRMGVLGTGVGDVGDETAGAKAAKEILDRLAAANEEIAINMKAIEAAAARVERMRAMEETRRRVTLETEMREFGGTSDMESLESERRRIAAQIADLRTIIAEYEKLGAQNEEVAEAIRETTNELAQLEERQEALERVAAPLIQARDAEAKRIEAQQKEVERLTEALDAEAEARRQARTMTSEQIEERRREIREEIQAAEHAVRKLRMQGEGNKAAQEAIAEYNKKIERLRAETERLTRVTEPLVRQREREADLQERITNRNRALIDAVVRFDEDIRQLEEDTYKERAAIQQRYNERLVQIAQDAAKEAAEALKQLQERFADMRRDYLQGEAEAQTRYNERLIEARIQFQRDEAKAYEDHAKRLEGILRDAQRREEDLILARDFAGLFQARRDTSYALQDANREFNEQRAERAKEFNVRMADEAAQFEKERQQRAIEYAKRIAEVQEQFNKERQLAEQRRIEALNEARIARDRERAELEQNYRQQLDARRIALQRELADIADFGRRKAEVERAALERGLQMIGATIDRFTRDQINKMNAEIGRMQAATRAVEDAARRAQQQALPTSRPTPTGGGGVIQRRAGGGKVYKGAIYQVNESGSSRREGFNNVPFPPVGGLFLPLRDGTINGNVARDPRTPPNIALTFNVTGAGDPSLTAEAIRRIVVRTMQDVLV